MKLRLAIFALALLPAAIAMGAANSIQDAPPANAPKDPAKLRAHDLHQDLLVGADPWIEAEDYKPRFPKKSPYDIGVIAIDVYVRNDGASPVQINLNTIRLTVAFPNEPDQNLPPLRPEVVANYMLSKDLGDPQKRKIQLPTRSTGMSKEMKQTIDQLRDPMFSTDLIPPHGTVHGLFYFDMGGQFGSISYCRLYIPDLKVMGTDKTLFFFDVPLVPSPAK
jgi:hypothetical protein